VGWARFARLIERSVSEFFADRCTQFAAAIAYYALFSIFPFAILAVVVFGLVISGEEARTQVINFLLDNLPLSQTSGRSDLNRLLTGVTQSAGTLGVVGVAGLVFSASGLMGAIRNALNAAFDAGEIRRPPLQGKALDVLLVFGTGVVIGVSLGLTLFIRLVARASSDVSALGGIGPAIGGAILQAGQFVPLLLSLAVFTFLYVVVPTRRVRVRDVWPGAILAGLGYEAVKTGFSAYLGGFANYDIVYGSLGAVVAFLVFVLVAAAVFLLGGEMAAEWPRVRDATEEDLLAPAEPIGRRVWRLLRGLVRRQPP
jgi:membrane protein